MRSLVLKTDQCFLLLCFLIYLGIGFSFILGFSYKKLFYKNHKVQKIKISLSKTFIRTLIPMFQRMSFSVKSVITIMLQERYTVRLLTGKKYCPRQSFKERITNIADI